MTCACGKPVVDGATCGASACVEKRRERPTVRITEPVRGSTITLRTHDPNAVSTGAMRIFLGACVFCGSHEHRTSRCPEAP